MGGGAMNGRVWSGDGDVIWPFVVEKVFGFCLSAEPRGSARGLFPHPLLLPPPLLKEVPKKKLTNWGRKKKLVRPKSASGKRACVCLYTTAERFHHRTKTKPSGDEGEQNGVTAGRIFQPDVVKEIEHCWTTRNFVGAKSFWDETADRAPAIEFHPDRGRGYESFAFLEDARLSILPRLFLYHCWSE